jgi:hypothetical protein
MVFVPPLPIAKRRYGGVLRNLKMRGAIIAAITREKRWTTIKTLYPQWATEKNFFHRAFANPCTI